MEMALSVGVVIDRPLVWGIGVKLGDGLVEIPAGLCIGPLIIVANPHKCMVAWIEGIFLVELLENQQCLVIFPALEIFNSHPQAFAVTGLLGHEREDERCRAENRDKQFAHLLCVKVDKAADGALAYGAEFRILVGAHAAVLTWPIDSPWRIACTFKNTDALSYGLWIVG